MDARGKHSLLLVDDEPEILRSLRLLLRLDFEVHCCNRPAEAMDVLKEQEVHVIMTDQRMPEMSGVELLTQVRSHHPDAVRMIFTGYSDIRAVIEAINQGHIYRYITKPWDPDELRSVLGQAAAEYDARIERKQALLQASQFAQHSLHFLKGLDEGQLGALNDDGQREADALSRDGHALSERLDALSPPPTGP